MNSITCAGIMQKVYGSAVAKTAPQDVVCGEMSQMKGIWGTTPDGEKFVDYPIGDGPGSSIGLAESFRQSPPSDEPIRIQSRLNEADMRGHVLSCESQWKSIFGEAKKVLKQLGVDGSAEENEPLMRIGQIDRSETASDGREPVHVIFNTAPIAKPTFPPRVLGRDWTIAALLPPERE